MGVPFNELNRAFDLGFRPLPWGDRGYVPSALQPADGAKSEGPAPKESSSPKAVPKGEGQPRVDVFTRLTTALSRNGNDR
jgi:hypothetical protein